MKEIIVNPADIIDLEEEEEKEVSLYEKLDGRKVIGAVVEEFYNRMLADEQINYLFKDVDMDSLRKHQERLILYAFGGPVSHEHKLRVAHKGLNITHEQFERAIKHLNAAMWKYKVHIDESAKVEAFFRSLKPHIVGQ